MARRRKLTEGKKNIIAGLIEEYDIKTANDIQEALKDLLGGTIQEMLEAELSEHLGYKTTSAATILIIVTALSLRNLRVHTVKSLSMFLRTETVILSLKLFPSARKIFQRSSKRSYPCTQKA